MTPELLQERRIESEIRRAHQLERARSRARRRLAEEYPERYAELLAEEKMALSEGDFSDRRPWTTSELVRLRDLAPFGAAVIAAELGRSIGSVKKKAMALRISLRRPNSKVGLILGQPRNATLSGALGLLRLDVVNGEVDIERIDRRRRATELCPVCGIRPQETLEGWCAACAVKALTRAYEAERALKAAERENDAARQQAHRASVTPNAT